MKSILNKTYLLSLFLVYFTISGFAQTVYSSKNDVFEAKSFTFYGYDFSKLRVADITREGQNLMPFFPATYKLLISRFNQKELEIIFRKGKNNIPFNTTATEISNSKIDNSKIVTSQPQKISIDSLSEMIKKYDLTEKEGIGSVIIFECFDREAQTESAFMVFFDIASRNILYHKHVESKDRNGYNYMGDWKKAALVAIPRLLDLCASDFNQYRKEQKELNKK